tara:strand:+ start:204 stop:473 length:270 start_codon:yes stop_codon:yes gene_type:complete
MFIALALLLLLLGSVVVILLVSRPTRGIGLIMAGCLLGFLALFCIIGFLASNEPGVGNLAQIIYASIFFISLVLGCTCLALGVKLMNRS